MRRVSEVREILFRVLVQFLPIFAASLGASFIVAYPEITRSFCGIA